MKIAIVEGTQAEIMAVLEQMRVDAIAPKIVRRNVPQDEIMLAVRKVTGFELGELFSRNSAHELSYARHLAMYLLRKDGGLSVKQTAELFNRNHATIIEGVRRIELERATRPETLHDLERIRLELKSGEAT